MAMMNLRDFRIGWRLLFKEPAYSAVVVLGLGVELKVLTTCLSAGTTCLPRRCRSSTVATAEEDGAVSGAGPSE